MAEVSGFSQALQTLEDIPIVKAALAYDNPLTGETIILITNQALFFGDQLEHILLNPNQMRMHDIIVEDTPKHLSRGKSSHSIYTEDQCVHIPLQLHGIISFFSVRTPTMHELENCDSVTLISENI